MNFSDPSPEIASIFNSVLKKIRPDQSELQHIKNVSSLITKFIKNSEIPSEITITFIEPQGSTGLKQTALKNTADIDFFIGIDPEIVFKQNFPSKKSRKEYLHSLFKKLTENWLIPCLKKNKCKDVFLSYAEHPYVSCNFMGIELDVVICFDISTEFLQKKGPITSVDRSPHHTRFIRDHLNKKQKDDVRLFKHFIKCHNCYGDKSAIGRSGFIGYSAELLISFYGSLWNLFNNFGELESKAIFPQENLIKIKNPYKNKTIQSLRHDFFCNDFLIILDPTDLNRNVGSSISKRAFKLINNEIKKFCEKPDISLFEYQEIQSLREFEISNDVLSRYFYVEYEEVLKDHYTKYRDKLYSLMDQVIKKASKESTLEPRFKNVVGELIFSTESGQFILAFFTETPFLSKTYRRNGPRKKSKTHYTKFKDKHPDAFEENGQPYLILQRPFIHFKKFLDDFIPKKPIKGLKISKIGSARDSDYSLMAGKSMGNLHKNIIPFIS